MSERPDGYIADVKCTLHTGNGDYDPYYYRFTSHMVQRHGVCWGPVYGCDSYGKVMGYAGMILWSTPKEAEDAFWEYAKTHRGEWDLLAIYGVKGTDSGFKVVCIRRKSRKDRR